MENKQFDLKKVMEGAALFSSLPDVIWEIPTGYIFEKAATCKKGNLEFFVNAEGETDFRINYDYWKVGSDFSFDGKERDGHRFFATEKEAQDALDKQNADKWDMEIKGIMNDSESHYQKILENNDKIKNIIDTKKRLSGVK